MIANTQSSNLSEDGQLDMVLKGFPDGKTINDFHVVFPKSHKACDSDTEAKDWPFEISINIFSENVVIVKCEKWGLSNSNYFAYFTRNCTPRKYNFKTITHLLEQNKTNALLAFCFPLDLSCPYGQVIYRSGIGRIETLKYFGVDENTTCIFDDAYFCIVTKDYQVQLFNVSDWSGGNERGAYNVEIVDNCATNKQLGNGVPRYSFKIFNS